MSLRYHRPSLAKWLNLVLLNLLLLGACRASEPGIQEEAVPADSAAAAAGQLDPYGSSPEEVIDRYYAAIDAGEYELAYALWGDGGGASGQSFEEFVAGYAATQEAVVEVGEVGRVEGAAGSRFVRVPVVIRARLRSGQEQRFEGSYALRRTVVDGSTEAQRRWHIYSADIRPAR